LWKGLGITVHGPNTLLTTADHAHAAGDLSELVQDALEAKAATLVEESSEIVPRRLLGIYPISYSRQRDRCRAERLGDRRPRLFVVESFDPELAWALGRIPLPVFW
jgi:hypothetical protein